MLQPIIIYGIKASISFLIFTCAYYLLLRRLTFFSLMRYYLLASIVGSLILPFINISFFDISLFSNNHFPGISANHISISQNLQPNNTHSGFAQAIPNYDLSFVILYAFLSIYLFGLSIKIYVFSKKINTVLKYIKNNQKIKTDKYWIVNMNHEIPAFSFFNYIFLNRQFKNLSKNDFDTILKHEEIHIKQFHTFDIIFIELVAIVFWFNPLFIYVRKTLQELHEYIVDEKIALQGENKKRYSELLLTLASEENLINISAGFAGNQITRRIKMIMKSRSLSVKKALFLIFVPLTAILLLSFANNDAINKQSDTVLQKDTINPKIGKIVWTDNTVFSDNELYRAFGLKSGDEFDKYSAGRLLNKNVGDLYLEKGYIFFNGEIIEHENSGVVNLEIVIFEGERGRIGKVFVTGNKVVPEKKILKKMKLKSGNLFSRIKLNDSILAIRGIKNISDKSTIRLIPKLDELTKDGYYLIDLEIEITETIN